MNKIVLAITAAAALAATAAPALAQPYGGHGRNDRWSRSG